DLGLSEAALKLQQRALQVHTVTGRENSNALLGLAELYTLSDRFRESLDTLTYLDTYAPSKDKVRRQLAQANAHLGLKDLDSAEKAYRRAIAAAPEQALPRRSLGLLLARNNRCTEAVTYLKDDTNPDAALAGTRCLLELGEPTLAHATATDVLAQADNEWTAEHAAWLASVAALDAVPTPPLPPPESPVTPLWRELLAEEWAIASLKRRLFATEEQ
ncbi:MAG: hypothetical protein GWP91_22395, partial [Rhodobacterales bacterium]|nr:hypothetical protein [Rhodobacterales bacterium]